ncbi:MAG: tripartite tricarboxylate transporter substrate binding protein, partial [Lysinibacillus sp.]
MKRRLTFLSVAALTLALAGCSGGGSDSAKGKGEVEYPERNIEVLVGHGAGGGTDLFVRAVTEQLEKDLDVNFNVINQEGGAGVIAAQNAFNAEADGYTLIGDAAFPISTAAGTNKHGLDDIVPIARFQNDTYALWVKKDEFESIEQFVKAAKENPNKISIGGTGSLGMDEIIVFLLGQEADLDFNFLPMNGSGEMHAGIVGGHINAMVDEFGPTKSLYEDGSIVPLVVFSEERIEGFEDVPTTVELGWDLTEGNERGFYVKKGTDQAIIDKLEASMKKVYDSETYKEFEKNNYLHIREGWLNSEDFTKRTE